MVLALTSEGSGARHQKSADVRHQDSPTSRLLGVHLALCAWYSVHEYEASTQSGAQDFEEEQRECKSTSMQAFDPTKKREGSP